MTLRYVWGSIFIFESVKKLKPIAHITQDALKIKERFFSCGLEIIRPVKYRISDSYPAMNRDIDPLVRDEFDRANQKAQFLLYEQRNAVQGEWLPRYDITQIGKHIPSEDLEELRGLLVEGCLERLAERIIANCPIMVKSEYVPGIEESVNRSLKVEKKNLSEYLNLFFVKRKTGVPSIAEEYGYETVS